ncbi:hypothetical protein [Streptomyces sp. NPDC001165]|uniref:hypothetical protein n=1 Tax=Streptomyces sp. NPDC001165 TaxID=3364546 RepID=UPI0036AC3AFE
MPDLLWDDVADWFDPKEMGTLPDLRVPGASVADWQAVLDLVRDSGLRYCYEEGDTVLPLPRAAPVLARLAGTECPNLSVWLAPGIVAIFRFYSDDEIDFDVDLRELQGQERLDVLCGFLRSIGRRLDKPVLMDPEGAYGHPMLGYDPKTDRVLLLAAFD